MATMKTAKAPKAAKTKAVAVYDEKLAEIAKLYQTAEKNSGDRQFFGTKGGVLVYDDAPIQGNRMAVIILDSIHENSYYEGEYDPDVKAGPVCFAFSRDPEIIPLAPHADSPNPQSETCATCPHNKFGSAIKGAGKACKNTRRVAMIPAGIINKQGQFEWNADEDHFKAAVVGFMKLPVTSTKAYGAYVKQLASTMRKPPFGVVTEVSLAPHPDHVFEVTFSAIETVPNDLMGIIIERHEEIAATIDFPYAKFEEEAKPAKGAKGAKQSAKKAVAKPATKPAVKKKY